MSSYRPSSRRPQISSASSLNDAAPTGNFTDLQYNITFWLEANSAFISHYATLRRLYESARHQPTYGRDLTEIIRKACPMFQEQQIRELSAYFNTNLASGVTIEDTEERLRNLIDHYSTYSRILPFMKTSIRANDSFAFADLTTRRLLVDKERFFEDETETVAPYLVYLFHQKMSAEDAEQQQQYLYLKYFSESARSRVVLENLPTTAPHQIEQTPPAMTPLDFEMSMEDMYEPAASQTEAPSSSSAPALQQDVKSSVVAEDETDPVEAIFSVRDLDSQLPILVAAWKDSPRFKAHGRIGFADLYESLCSWIQTIEKEASRSEMFSLAVKSIIHGQPEFLCQTPSLENSPLATASAPKRVEVSMQTDEIASVGSQASLQKRISDLERELAHKQESLEEKYEKEVRHLRTENQRFRRALESYSSQELERLRVENIQLKQDLDSTKTARDAALSDLDSLKTATAKLEKSMPKTDADPLVYINQSLLHLRKHIEESGEQFAAALKTANVRREEHTFVRDLQHGIKNITHEVDGLIQQMEMAYIELLQQTGEAREACLEVIRDTFNQWKSTLQRRSASIERQTLDSQFTRIQETRDQIVTHIIDTTFASVTPCSEIFRFVVTLLQDKATRLKSGRSSEPILAKLCESCAEKISSMA
eukprot:TRINITY_DN11794_c0_g1_i2.p1 TRINITY_DN11794_c0_g1~~TRINITY_DN11794_c0_g1_i2.p1  ORF type:complete len:652 (-),score=152.91 TRINITY_DN11794_c0_g1_i2:295-2250(-)